MNPGNLSPHRTARKPSGHRQYSSMSHSESVTRRTSPATTRKGEHDRPDDYKEMLKIASDLTKALRTPFMRVDMFAGPNGPVVGELTPSPGDAFYGNNFKYTEEYDMELGQAWIDAEKRIAGDIG